MMNFKKLGIIIQREYLNKVKKKSFLLITFLAPILFAGICILPTVIMMGTKEEAKNVGVIDRSGIVLPYLEDNDVTHYIDLGPDAVADSLKANLKAAGVDVLLSISELDLESRSVKADCYSEKPLGMDTGSMIEDRINDAVEAYRIEQSGVENLEEIMAGVKSNVKLRSYTIDESGKETISESGIYMALSMILGMAIYMFIALFSGMVMSSVIEEKSSRVVEVLVSSVRASELLFGKIIGVALVAITQFLLWILLTGMLLGVAMGIMGKDKIMGLMSDDPTTEMVQQMSPDVDLPGQITLEDSLKAVTAEMAGDAWQSVKNKLISENGSRLELRSCSSSSSDISCMHPCLPLSAAPWRMKETAPSCSFPSPSRSCSASLWPCMPSRPLTASWCSGSP